MHHTQSSLKDGEKKSTPRQYSQPSSPLLDDVRLLLYEESEKEDFSMKEEGHSTTSSSSDSTLYSSLGTVPTRYHLPSHPSSRSVTSNEQCVHRDAEFDDASHHPAIYASTSKKRCVPPLLLIGSVLGILCCTAGMATTMLLWIYTHKLPLQSPGVIYLHEGVENEIGREYKDKTIGDSAKLTFNELSSHPTTLSLSSVIVFLIGSSLYPMMGLIAYGLAANWIHLQVKIRDGVGTSDQLPTPLQYALLTRLCSSNCFSAILETCRHWYSARHSHGVTFPAILKRALTWLIVLLSLHTSIAVLDFLLHETTRTVSVIDVNETISDLPYSMGINQDLCPPKDGLSSYPCLLAPLNTTEDRSLSATFAVNNPLVNSEGWLVANKASREYAVLIYKDTHDDDINNMAYYSNPNVRSQDFLESGSSIGLKTKCEMLTSKCSASPSRLDCGRVGRPEVDRQRIVVRPEAPNTTEYLAISDVIYSIDDSGAAVLGKDSLAGPQSNPWSLSGLIVNPSATTEPHSGFQDFSLMNITNGIHIASSYSYGAFTCNLTFRDVQFSFFNGTYNMQSWTTSHASVANDLSGPLLANLVTNVAFSAVASVAGRVDDDSFSRSLEESLSFNVLALSAGLISRKPGSVQTWQTILAQQYDKAILFGYIAHLYAYALVAIFLFFWTWGMSSTSIVYSDVKGRRREVPAVVLAQRRLMEPASYLVAMQFTANSTGDGSAGKLSNPQLFDTSDATQKGDRAINCSSSASRSAQIDILDLFNERHQNKRVAVGLNKNGLGFGVWPTSEFCNDLSPNLDKRGAMP